jgi:hypothetical protein
MISTTPQRLYLLQLQTSTLQVAGGRTLDMVLGCYLVETSDGKHILIDSGLAADATGDAESRAWKQCDRADLRPGPLTRRY